VTGRTQKEIALTAFTGICGAGVFGLLTLSIVEPPSLIILTAAVTAALIWAALLALAFALVRWGSAAVLIWSLPLLLITVGGFKVGVLTAALPVLAALAMARWRIRDQISDSLGFRPARIFYGGMRWICLAILLAAAGLAVAPVRTTVRTAEIAIPEEVVAAALAPVEPILAGLITEGAAAPIPLITAIVNSYLNTILHNSPLLSALAAAVAVLFVSRLLVSLAAWPALILVIACVYGARQTRFAYLVKRQVETSRLELTEPDHG
jgi:hypothetical protein